MQRHLPAPIAPPKGLAGVLEGYIYEPGAILDTSKFPPSMVLLNVYDVSDSDLFTRINRVTTANNNILVGGVFHAGVEIYNKEWCYGVTEYGRSGVAAVHPRTHPQHTYRCTVPLGATKITDEDAEVLLERLSQEWPGHEYDLIHHNCISFCNALLRELLPGGRVPGWVDRAMRTAGFIDHTSRRVREETHQAAEVVRTISADIEQKARTLTASEALDMAQRNSEKLVEKAGEGVNVLRSSLWEWGEGLQRGIEEQTQDLPPEIGQKAELVRRKTQEIGDELGEKAQAFGASLWQWGQDLQTKSVWGLADEASSNLQSSVASLVENTPMSGYSMPSAPRPKLETKGLLDDEDDDLLLAPMRDDSNMGLIRTAEEQSLQQGLLAEVDDDDCVDLIGISAALQDHSSNSAVVEAPLEWSSPPIIPSAIAPEPVDAVPVAAGTEPIWDLLSPESHVVYGHIDVETEVSVPLFDNAGPAKSKDPFDNVDLLGY